MECLIRARTHGVKKVPVPANYSLRTIGLQAYVWEVKKTGIHGKTLVEALYSKFIVKLVQ